jgi:hypothetical protein
MPNADAASKFDGTWSAVFRTKSGPCQPAYRGAVQVVDGNMEMAGAGGSLSGRVLSNGSVKATGSCIGISSPSAAEVLRLITRSNLSGRCMGKSLGLAPCKIFAT